MQKWPNSMTFIRHAESAYNAHNKEFIPGFKEFQALFEKEYEQLTHEKIANGLFPTEKLKKMALELIPKLSPKTNDYDTDITDNGWQQAVKTGAQLPDIIPLPQKIYISPYKRTRRTLDGIIEGWPELKNVKTLEDDRLREQEHGKRTIYGDPAIYCVLHPEYALQYKFSTKYEYKHENGESLLDVRERLRSFTTTAIREHGGTPETLKDKLIEAINGEIIGKVLNTFGIQADTKPEDLMLVTHHLSILAARANLERWSREKFLAENEQNRPVNCGVTIYRGIQTKEKNSRQGRNGRLVLNPGEYNIKLY